MKVLLPFFIGKRRLDLKHLENIVELAGGYGRFIPVWLQQFPKGQIKEVLLNDCDARPLRGEVLDDKLKKDVRK